MRLERLTMAIGGHRLGAETSVALWHCNLEKKDYHSEDYRPDRGEAAHYLWTPGIWRENSTRKRDTYAQALRMRRPLWIR